MPLATHKPFFILIIIWFVLSIITAIIKLPYRGWCAGAGAGANVNWCTLFCGQITLHTILHSLTFFKFYAIEVNLYWLKWLYCSYFIPIRNASHSRQVNHYQLSAPNITKIKNKKAAKKNGTKWSDKSKENKNQI